MTATFVLLLARLQWAETAPKTAAIGYATAAVIVVGTSEGLALSMGADGGAFGMATIVGFMGLTLWMLATGIGLIRTRRT